MINPDKVVAIDVHVHAEVSCTDPEDPVMGKFFDAATSYFKAPRQRPTIQETIDYYRAQKMGFCLFTVDCEAGLGAKRIRNEEIAALANANSDVVIPFASIDPHKGKMGAREARNLIEDHGVKGFKFHPPMQDCNPADRIAYPIYEVIAEYRLPAIFHTGHSGPGPTKACRWLCIRPMFISISVVGRPNISRNRLSATPTASSATRCCSGQTFRLSALMHGLKPRRKWGSRIM